MRCSLVITTYNWKEALEVVLLSVLSQSTPPDEIIIADDGSNDETRSLIEKYISVSKIPIIHSWQEDDGFRAAQSRNKAIAKSSCEYIVLIDGDIVLEHNFIHDHKKFAKEGFFSQGSRVLLGKKKSLSVLNSKKAEISFFDNDIRNRKNTVHSDPLAKIFSQTSVKLSGIKTCNMGFYKTDFIKVNGFNNRFIGWGREDSEFIVRMMNSGVKRVNIKFNAICYHLWHEENTRDSLPENDVLLEQSIQETLLYCSDGVKRYL